MTDTSLEEQYSQVVHDIQIKGLPWTEERKRVVQLAQEHKERQLALTGLVDGLLPSHRELFQGEVLQRHNELRNLHSNTSPVTMNLQIQAGAQEWANQLLDKGRLEHKGGGVYGENLYFCNSPMMFQPTGAKVSDCWYKEKKSYNFVTGETNDGNPIGHFTQLVWRETKEIGVGISSDGKGTYYVCVRYEPRGNMTGQYLQNVGEMKPGATM